MNRELLHAREKRWRQSAKGRAKRNTAQKKRRKSDPYMQRRSVLKWKYGLTVSQFEAMRVAQGNRCAICFREGGEHHHKKLKVDHNHITGEVRGLLCHQCNAALGMFCDCIPVIKNAIQYLRENNAPEHGL